MKKVLAFLLVFGIASLASAGVVSLVPTPETATDLGGGRYEATGDTVTIQVWSTSALLSLGATVSGAPVNSAANLVGDSSFQKDPVIDGSSVLLVTGDFNGIGVVNDVMEPMAEVIIPAPTDTEYVVGIVNEPSAFGGSLDLVTFQPPDFAEAITIIPEPMTLSLLGLGGLALIRRRRA